MLTAACAVHVKAVPVMYITLLPLARRVMRALCCLQERLLTGLQENLAAYIQG